MNIGAITDTANTNAKIALTYAGGGFLIIIDTDTMSVVEIHDASERKSFCDILVRTDCECIVCGRMEQPEFELIAGECITRYNGAGLPVGDAVKQAEAGRLLMITEYSGGGHTPGQDGCK